MKDEGGIVRAAKASNSAGQRGDRVRSRRVPGSVLALSVLLGASAALVGDASAQDTAGAAGGVRVEAGADATRSVDLSPPTALSTAPEQNLTPEERVTRAKEFVMKIETSGQSIMRQLQTARKDRDVVRVLCLNDKLNQVDVALRSAQDRLNAVRSAAERADEDRLRHEYTVLEVLNDRVRVLVNESNQCVGEETGFIGEAEVSVSIDPNLPDANTGFVADWSATPPPPPNISSPIE